LLFAVEPVAAAAFGILRLGDSLTARQAVVAAAILAGAAVGEVARREPREGAWT
jgi:threonine/homoserine efflux transporter RhtA